MAVPTLKQQRAADIDAFYDPELPWVESAAIGEQLPFNVRVVSPGLDAGTAEGHPRRQDILTIKVRKTDYPVPAKGAKLTVAGQPWTVDQVAVANAREWQLTLIANVRIGF